MEKIVVSASEVAATQLEPPGPQPPAVPVKRPPAMAWWARLVLAPLVLVLPILCLAAIILRVAFRNQAPRERHAWTAYLSTLLIISGFLTSIATVLTLSFAPIPSIVSSGLSELDERTDFPSLPAKVILRGADAAMELKSLVAVISPAAQTLFGKREMLSNGFGAGMLVRANSEGFLFASALHVVGTRPGEARGKAQRALISMASGVWAGGDVIARHSRLDLVLIWLPRHSGQADFVQPVTRAREGENIFVIGHPEGLKFTLSTGIVSRREASVIQISAPISPGNSGGPVYDEDGNLIGVVSSMLDRSLQPNAENLNFAVATQALVEEAGWDFVPGGRERFLEFQTAAARLAKSTEDSAGEAPAAKKRSEEPTKHGHD